MAFLVSSHLPITPPQGVVCGMRRYGIIPWDGFGMVWDDTEKRAKPKGIKGKALAHRPILGGMISTKTRALGWFRNRPMGWFWDGSGMVLGRAGMTSTGAGWVSTGHGETPQPLRPLSRCAWWIPTLWTTTPHGLALWPVSPLLATIPRPRPHRNRTRLVGYFWAFWVCFGRLVRSAYSARADRSLRCSVCGHALSPYPMAPRCGG